MKWAWTSATAGTLGLSIWLALGPAADRAMGQEKAKRSEGEAPIVPPARGLPRP